MLQIVFFPLLSLVNYSNVNEQVFFRNTWTNATEFRKRRRHFAKDEANLPCYKELFWCFYRQPLLPK